MKYPSFYLNSDMTPFDIIGKQMDFLYQQGKKIAQESKVAIDYEDIEADIQIQKTIEEDLFEEETLCGRPHNNGDNSPEGCGGECMAIKLGI